MHASTIVIKSEPFISYLKIIIIIFIFFRTIQRNAVRRLAYLSAEYLRGVWKFPVSLLYHLQFGHKALHADSVTDQCDGCGRVEALADIECESDPVESVVAV